MLILNIVAIYLALGFLFAIAFLFKGINKIDPGAHGTRVGFKLLLIPGTLILWPLLLKKVVQTKKP